MRKVLYIIDSLQIGGAERSILDIASHLRCFQPVICHIYRNDSLKPEYLDRGIPVISLDIDSSYHFIKAYRAIKDVLKKEKPDLVVATLFRSEVLSRMACRAMHIPNVGTFVNDTYSRYGRQSLTAMAKLKVDFLWILNTFTARFCIGFLSNGVSIKESNCKALFIPPHKVHVVYRGRQKNQFKFWERQLKHRMIKFLAVGRLVSRKGFEDLLHAFHLYVEQFPGATLTIAGQGPLRERLEEMITAYSLGGKVHLLGTVMQIPELINNHDVLVFPSHYEGFSGVVVEAMFSGIPIIASDIPMNQEAIEHQRTGWLFPVKEVNGLLEAMVWMTQNFVDAQLFAREAYKVAEERFAIEIIAQQHDTYYNKVLKELGL